jgi:2-polyprenyl-6-methoxyphenol hydroxylase-like FAD-dependent oxidoreductase
MRVAVIGGGMIGLCTAMLLACDGNDVTVLERDGAEPPDPADAWEHWERRGVNQMRLAHLFLSRFRSFMDDELPELVADLEAAGACRYNIVDLIPAEVTGGTRPGDEAFEMLTGRRTVVEAVTAARCADTPGVSVRRASPVAGLVTGPGSGVVPHVTGVRLESGAELGADLVVDAAGRRSALPAWLEGIGASPCREEREDCGFVYYGRHFRSADGTLPALFGAPRQDYGTLTVLTLPADNGTWSVTLIASARDTALRSLRDADTWTRVVRSLPMVAHWVDGDPIEDHVVTMAKIEDRVRDPAPGGSPVATGLLSVGDAWACTNPSLGRGVSIGSMHAVALRDLLRETSDADPLELATRWAELTRSTVEPWYRSTLRFDRHRLNEVHAEMAGASYQSTDREWQRTGALGRATLANGDILRAQLAINMCLTLPDEVFSDPDFTASVLEAGAAPEDEARPERDRTALLETIGGP